MTTEEVMAEIIKDREFYQKSGGGVTLTGGEPLLSPDFVKELFEACHEQGISTAVETTGCIERETLTQLQGVVDYYLFDFKHPDSEKHKQWTGVGNEKILKNLEWLAHTNADITVRVPVIPGVNDQPKILQKIAGFLNRKGIRNRVLLPFHQYGSPKYASCGLEYSMKGVPALTEADVAELAKKSNFMQFS